MYVQPPVDYPKTKDTPTNQPGEITYAAILDLAEAEQPITDEMIREACNKMEAAQQYPFAPQPANTGKSQTSSTRPTRLLTLLTKLRSVRTKS